MNSCQRLFLRFEGWKSKGYSGEGRKTYSSTICESFGEESAVRDSLVSEIGLACHKDDRDSFATD